jgi:hypothetical protein
MLIKLPLPARQPQFRGKSRALMVTQVISAGAFIVQQVTADKVYIYLYIKKRVEFGPKPDDWLRWDCILHL